MTRARTVVTVGRMDAERFASRARPKPRHWLLLDAAAAAVALPVAWTHVLGARDGYDPHGRGYPAPGTGQVAVALAASVVLALAFALRRFGPAWAAGAVFAAWAAVVAVAGDVTLALVVGGPFMVLAAMGVGYAAAATYRPRGAAAVLAVLLGACALWWFGTADLRHAAWLAPVFTLAAWAVGSVVRRNRAYAAELRRREADRARAEAGEERLRLARELHDVIAHSLSVVNVQAGYGGYVLDKRPEEAREALAVIQRTSRETIAEMRGLLAVLRGSAAAERLPAPTLADLPELVRGTCRTGLRVELRREGTARTLPPGVELCAYRIVQEALANVVRHAGARTAWVVLRYDAHELAVEIGDDGTAGAGAEPADGHGIGGMRERVAVYGGTLVAAPRPDGGFGVAAVLPIPAEVRSGAVS